MFKPIIFLSIIFLASDLSACPLIADRFIDFNCDQRFKVAFTGDSITRGVGDRDNGNRGGYVKRVRRFVRQLRTSNLGNSGATAGELFSQLRRDAQNGRRGIINRLADADIVIIDVGRNGFGRNIFNDIPPESVVRNIRRTVRFLRRRVRSISGVTPLVIVNTLIPSQLPGHQGYVDAINNILLRDRSDRLPVELLYHRNVTTSVLSSDRLHPDSAGYESLARLIARFLRNKAQRLQAAEREDLDEDGIFDIFEEQFGTMVDNPDSDGDGIPDGIDVFGE